MRERGDPWLCRSSRAQLLYDAADSKLLQLRPHHSCRPLGVAAPLTEDELGARPNERNESSCGKRGGNRLARRGSSYELPKAYKELALKEILVGKSGHVLIYLDNFLLFVVLLNSIE